MSDTRHPQVPHPSSAAANTATDGVNYAGLVWFVVILIGTTLLCQGLVWGMFRFMEKQAAAVDQPLVATAAPFGEVSPDCAPKPEVGGHPTYDRPCIATNGQVESGRPTAQPHLMADDPIGLKAFRDKEDDILEHYGVMDKNSGVYRIPIDRAKELVLQRGISGGSPMAATPAAPAAPIKK
jgi:hypothetical protein